MLFHQGMVHIEPCFSLCLPGGTQLGSLEAFCQTILMQGEEAVMLVLCFIYESGVSSCSSLYRPETLPAAQLPAFTQQLLLDLVLLQGVISYSMIGEKPACI